MTAHHDLDRQLNAFLLDGPTSLPDSSFDAVRDRTEQTRQRVVLGPWRVPTLNKLVPVGLGAAALVVALLLGSRFIGSPSSNVGGPAVEPTATAEPSARGRCRWPAGRPHLLSDATDGGVPITVTIAAPLWGGDPNGGYMCWDGAPDCAVGMIAFEGPEYYVFGDACHYMTTKPGTPATTVDEFIDAIANQGSREASAPEDITVDGHAGKKIILHMADDVDITTCDGGGDSLTMFGSRGEDRGRYSPPGAVEEVLAVDVDGVVVVLIGGYYADSPQNAVDEMRAILASATFE